MIRLNQVKMPLNHTNEALEKQILKELRLPTPQLQKWSIKKESLDARKEAPMVVYTIDCKLKDEAAYLKKAKNAIIAPKEAYTKPSPSQEKRLKHRPVVIGYGPAGMFAAWLFAEMGYKPIVIERGSEVDQRSKDIDLYWEQGILNPESNVQFGEGGAGTFSDGKLTTRIKDPRAKAVLEILTAHGAPEEILYRNKPHIGTDLLKPTVKQMREELIKKGTQFLFNTKVENFHFEDFQLTGLTLSTGETLKADQAVLAIGHSARDTFEVMANLKIHMTPKPFAIGVRIEHPQLMIDKNQYGKHENELSERFGAAEYHLTTDTTSGRSVYTFCMCPGGFVVGAASELNTIVTNGMSEHARNQTNANSALLVSISPDDFPGDHILAGVDLQRQIEKKAFEMGGCSHKAPAMSVGAFLGTKPVHYQGDVNASYKPGVQFTDLAEGLPQNLVEALREALPKLDQKLKGFAMEDAIMTGFETRTSSPVRIVRDPLSFESVSHKGLYPCGEGAGYAGGIMSSACDGLRIAEQIIQNYGPAEE